MLNTITGGYAVGIGGIVAFLPFSSCSLVSAGRIGALQARRPDAAKNQPPHAAAASASSSTAFAVFSLHGTGEDRGPAHVSAGAEMPFCIVPWEPV